MTNITDEQLREIARRVYEAYEEIQDANTVYKFSDHLAGVQRVTSAYQHGDHLDVSLQVVLSDRCKLSETNSDALANAIAVAFEDAVHAVLAGRDIELEVIWT